MMWVKLRHNCGASLLGSAAVTCASGRARPELRVLPDTLAVPERPATVLNGSSAAQLGRY
jgi:hypothetical protein